MTPALQPDTANGVARSAAVASVGLPTMFAIGWLAFGARPGLREVLAGTLVLVAIIMTPVRSPRPRAPDKEIKP